MKRALSFWSLKVLCVTVWSSVVPDWVLLGRALSLPGRFDIAAAFSSASGWLWGVGDVLWLREESAGAIVLVSGLVSVSTALASADALLLGGEFAGAVVLLSGSAGASTVGVLADEA